METTGVLDRTPQPAADSVAPDPAVVLDGLVSTLVSVESTISSLQAMREYTLALASRVAEAMNDDGARPGCPAGGWDSRSAELAQRAVAAEIATATRMSDRTVQRQMSQAVELLDRFPATFNSLAHGRISLTHVRIIQDSGAPLDDPEVLARYEAAVLPCAEQHAPTRLRRVATREAEKLQPETLAVRHEQALAGRCVRVTPLPDGMAELAATLPTAVAYGIHDRLTHMAKAHSDSHDGGKPDCGRNTDQLRADLLADLLLRGAPAGHDTPDGLLAAITARVDITIPVLTLINETAQTGATDHPPASTGERPGPSSSDTETHLTTGPGQPAPAELNGQHPIDPATAKLLAGQATAWNRVLTDPITGAILAVGRYRPGKDLKRLLTARDTRCRFPGCGIRARELDLDHTHDAALGGPTNAENLAGLCRRHHTLKHHSRWKVRQSGNGVLEWTSPTGRNYYRPPTHARHHHPRRGA